MKANELRIGNWLTGAFGVPFQVVKAFQIEDFAHTYHGIELNEEWLLKFGFEKKDYWYLEALRKSFYYNLEEEILFFQQDIGMEWFVLADANTLQYVHQLQNLHFALTGKELEVKEPIKNLT